METAMHTTPTAARHPPPPATPLVLQNLPRSLGFTLIELMIALAIMGILASVAYPTYTAYVNRTYRAQARATLLEASHYLERYYAANGTYTGAALPARLTTSPPGLNASAAGAATGARYTITVASAAATGYTLRAIPQSTDDCGALGLDQAGRQTADGATGQTGGMTVEACWR
jgi:type IV pilus assembly protein PilE